MGKTLSQSQKYVRDLLGRYREKGPVALGPYASEMWRNDPKHLLFTLARYKFCAKMLEGKKEVLDVGCGDMMGVAMILQTVDRVHGVDVDPLIVEDNRKRNEFGDRITFEVLDITRETPRKTFDAVISIDVIEHVPASEEKSFMDHICRSLGSDGLIIIGTPNVAAHPHAGQDSQESHINLKSHADLRELLERYFRNVFLFSMNDEVIHTGFFPMAHYLMGVGAGKRSD